jgi:uncharacterized DUF497 family protein
MFAWDTRKAISNFEKHGVSFEGAATVFGDADGLNWTDVTHSAKEPRFRRLGKSVGNRIILVGYTVRRARNGREAIRIISARQASRKERKAYAGH